jgi:hypothetical protein
VLCEEGRVPVRSISSAHDPGLHVVTQTRVFNISHYNKTAAIALIFGPEYVVNKRIFSEGLTLLDNAISTRVAHSADAARRWVPGCRVALDAQPHR